MAEGREDGSEKGAGVPLQLFVGEFSNGCIEEPVGPGIVLGEHLVVLHLVLLIAIVAQTRPI